MVVTDLVRAGGIGGGRGLAARLGCVATHGRAAALDRGDRRHHSFTPISRARSRISRAVTAIAVSIMSPS
jgi:hypothetical protein